MRAQLASEVSSSGDPREEMLAAGRTLAAAGLVRARSGNLSVRRRDQLLVTVAGARMDSLVASDILDVDPGASPPQRATSEIALHLAIYAARSDVGAVIHTHSPYATAWSCTADELVLDLDEAAYYGMGPRVAVAAHAPPGSARLADNARVALADRSAVLLRRHGAVAVGRDLADALCVAESLEHQAHVASVLRGARREQASGEPSVFG